jgi:hypothetical protein
MEDVRLYLRDLLREYAALQTFQPFRSEEARCMNWGRMLAEFGAPHARPNYVSAAGDSAASLDCIARTSAGGHAGVSQRGMPCGAGPNGPEFVLPRRQSP